MERDEMVRRRAHQIWEQEGRPHGRHEEHWRQALEALEAEDSQMNSLAGSLNDPAEPSTPNNRRARVKDSAAEPATPKSSRSRRKSEAVTTGPETATRWKLAIPSEANGQGIQPPDATPKAARRSGRSAKSGQAPVVPADGQRRRRRTSSATPESGPDE
jgi:hypothetical protein